MAPDALGRRSLAQVTADIADLLTQAGEERWANTIRSYINSLNEHAEGTPERHATIRKMLRLYGGMGSFQDLVLHEHSRVRAEQDRLEMLKSELFTALQKQLH